MTQTLEFNGVTTVATAISITATSNPLTVVEGIYKVLPQIEAGLPDGMKADVVYDSTKSGQTSIDGEKR